MLTFSTFAIAKSEILNHFGRVQNFVVNFQKDLKQNQQLTKYIKVELNLSNMP